MSRGELRRQGVEAAGERRWQTALREIEASIEQAWAADAAARPRGVGDQVRARAILDDPSVHPWRLVDAALLHLPCDECGTTLGSGRRGCAACDYADGMRFAAREPDRPGVPAGNEHAIRVASATLRAPDRYPEWVVAGNRLFLPLFIAGQMPTRPQQLALKAASQRGPLDMERLERAATFEELARMALATPPPKPER